MHPDSGLDDDGHIYQSSHGTVYNVMLNLAGNQFAHRIGYRVREANEELGCSDNFLMYADITTGINSYYVLQLIEMDNRKEVCTVCLNL